jgi:dolichol-phosphate mannosyltransferase
VLFNFLGIIAATSVNFILSSRLLFKPSVPKSLDPEAPPKEIAEEIRNELKADWVGLVRPADSLNVVAGSSGIPGPAPRPLTVADHGAIEMVLRTSQPTLVVTGPRRLPQARTNTRWGSSLAVPILDGNKTVGVFYATRFSTEEFTELDLHWLTAYASTGAQIFS